MEDPTHDKLLSDYVAQAPLYTELATVAKTLIEQLLADRGIVVHSVTCRAKERSSLSRKLEKPDRDYMSLDEITDLVGIRVTTYFEPDVSYVSALIEHEFIVDRKRSVNKGDLLDPDRFGYLSVHYIVALTKMRCRLAEYRRFGKIFFEVQVRSILQHAWAEIEHDLGYKSEHSVPKEIRRRFSRVAGLLELADAEFSAIRAELLQYQHDIPQRLKTEPEKVSIDLVSVQAFVTSNPLVRRLDKAIAKAAKGKVVAPSPDEIPEWIDNAIRRLRYFGFETIGEVQHALQERQFILVAFANHWWSDRINRGLRAGISLFYLAYLLIAEGDDLAETHDYLRTFNLGSREMRDEAARKIRLVYNKALGEEQKEEPEAGPRKSPEVK